MDFWECPDNWLTEDNFPADHAPCGSDRAFFDKVHENSLLPSPLYMILLVCRELSPLLKQMTAFLSAP